MPRLLLAASRTIAATAAGGAMAAAAAAATPAHRDPRLVVDLAALPVDDQVSSGGRPIPPRIGSQSPQGPAARPRAEALSDEEADEARATPWLRVDVAVLAGYDSNPDEIDETEATATAAVEVAARGAIGGEAARLDYSVEGAVAVTPQVPARRFYGEGELDGRVRIVGDLDAVATLGASRYSLTQPQEGIETATAGVAVDRDGLEASIGLGYETRRYRDTDRSDDGPDDEEAGELDAAGQPVRNLSDNAVLRILDYARVGIDAEVTGGSTLRPFLSASLYRIRFPTPSEEIADRAAADLALAGGATLVLSDGVDLSAGLRYNRRRFRDAARATASHLVPALGLKIDRGILDLALDYGREYTQPEVTGAIARDVRLLELEAELHPHPDWRVFLDASREIGRELLAGARDTEIELTGRVEYQVSPPLWLLVEAYWDRYRYFEDDALSFGSNRITLRTGLRGRF